MGKSLVIVESPAKAKTINKYLGNDFIVKSSIGHVRDLPTSGSSKAKVPATKTPAEVRKMEPEEKAAYKKQRDYTNLVARMGIDPNQGWDPHYEILPGKEKLFKNYKSWQKMQTKYISQRIWIEKGKQLLGTFKKSLVVILLSISA